MATRRRKPPTRAPKRPLRARKRTPQRKPNAGAPKQPVIIAQTVPASASSDTPAAKKLLKALGRDRPTTRRR